MVNSFNCQATDEKPSSQTPPFIIHAPVRLLLLHLSHQLTHPPLLSLSVVPRLVSVLYARGEGCTSPCLCLYHV